MTIPQAEGSIAQQVPAALVNLRDVATAHPSLMPGVLLRSDAPLATDDHTAYAVPWPPRTVVDLRRPAEHGGSHAFDGRAVVVNLPIGGKAAYEDDEPISSLGELYRRMLLPPRSEAIVAAMATIADGEAPVLVHCTAGKDRTGVTVALALMLVGVDRDSIVADYALTDSVMQGVFARMPATIAGLPAGSEPAEVRIPEWLRGAPAEAIAEFIDALEEHGGGAVGWYLANGGDAGVVERLRARLLA